MYASILNLGVYSVLLVSVILSMPFWLPHMNRSQFSEMKEPVFSIAMDPSEVASIAMLRLHAISLRLLRRYVELLRTLTMFHIFLFSTVAPIPSGPQWLPVSLTIA